ncbi:MAG: hypothetical protein V7K92_26800 [Nostoc sp.]|uniref:hypothetical protein n=1 Tax=Nostoc sp. TaxID=1180 RepID=UPI002FEFB04E
MTPVVSSRETLDARLLATATLTAVPPGGNPHRPWRLPLGEDRTASPQRWLLYAGEPVHRSGSP